MKKQTSLLWATIAIALSLVTVAAARREATATIRLNPAIGINIRDVRKVQIYHGAYLHAAFDSSDGKKWNITSDLIGAEPDAADRIAIGDLMQLLYRMRTRPAEGVTLQEAKLDNLNDAIQIVVQDAGDAAQTDSIYLGGVSADGKERYFVTGKEPEKVNVVDHDLTRVVERPVMHLRSWDLFDLDVNGPEQIELRNGEKGVVLERALGGWALIKPMRWPADPKKLQQFLMACAALRAVDFAPSTLTPAAAGITDKSPLLRLRQKGREQVVRFGKSALGGRGVYAMREGRPTIYIVNPMLAMAAKNPKSEAYRQDALPLFAPGTLAEIEIELGAETLRLAQENGRWVGRGARTYDADPAAIQQLAGVLQQLQVVGFPEDQAAANADLKTPSVRLQGSDASGQRLFDLRVGQVHSDGTVYGKSEGREEVVLLHPQQALFLSKPFIRYQTRLLTDFNWDDIGSISVTTDGKTTVFKHGKGTQFTVSAPTPALLTEPSIYRLVTTLPKMSQLQVVDFIEENPRDLSEFGLDQPLVHVVVMMKSAKGIPQDIGLDLVVGKPYEVQDGTGKRVRFYFAQRGKSGPVFLIKDDLVESFTKPFDTRLENGNEENK